MSETIEQTATVATTQPAPSVPSVEVELWRQSVLGLVKQYGNERATEAYHGDLHCREAPKDVFAEIEMALDAAPKQEAQPVPSEQDESVRKAWARFSHELHRSPDAPYPGMADAFEQHFSQSFTDRDWRVESGVWAAAWKAAKRHGAKGE